MLQSDVLNLTPLLNMSPGHKGHGFHIPYSLDFNFFGGSVVYNVCICFEEFPTTSLMKVSLFLFPPYILFFGIYWSLHQEKDAFILILVIFSLVYSLCKLNSQSDLSFISWFHVLVDMNLSLLRSTGMFGDVGLCKCCSDGVL